jgi:hypothetical protein
MGRKKKSADNEDTETASKKCKWTSSQQSLLIDHLAKMKGEGNQAETGWKPIVWTSAAALLREHYPDDIPEKDPVKCNECWSRLKKEFKIVKTLRGLSGFGWDESKQIVTATDKVWEAYLAEKSHKDARPFRKKPFPLYDQIAEIVDSVIARGDDVFGGDEEDGSRSGDESHSSKGSDESDLEEDKQSKQVKSTRMKVPTTPSITSSSITPSSALSRKRGLSPIPTS